MSVLDTMVVWHARADAVTCAAAVYACVMEESGGKFWSCLQTWAVKVHPGGRGHVLRVRVRLREGTEGSMMVDAAC